MPVGGRGLRKAPADRATEVIPAPTENFNGEFGTVNKSACVK